MFIREAQAASSLNHPNIVTVYEVIRSGPTVAIAMELVTGTSLRHLCGTAQPVEKLAHWGAQIAHALAAAHASGIVHRDIKPENLMLRPDGYIKVLDFGLAKQAGAGQTTSRLIAGTLEYMAPEQTRAEAATSGSDVFSLGIVLFELATGTHPFRANSPIDTAYAIAHAEPQQPSSLNASIPSASNALILAMLDKDPRKRPAAMDVNRHFSALNATGAGKRSRLALWVAAAALAVSISVVSVRAFRARIFSQKEPVVTQLTTQVNENRVTAAAISPDGSNLAFATFGGSVFLRRMGDGFSQALTTPAGLHVDRIAWFPDGSRLLVSGSLRDADKVGDYKVGIWLMAANGGRAENIISDGKSGVPSPDGTRIALTSADGSIIWVAPVNGSNPRQIRSGGQSSSFSSLIWSPDSKRLAYQRRDLVPVAGHQANAHWTQLERSYQYRYESIDVDTGRLAAEAKDFVMTSACALPDGRVLFLRWFSPELVHVHQMWELRTDPGTGRILAPPRQLTHSNNNTAMSSLSASNDGKQVVSVRYYQGPPNIWIADLPPADQAPRLLNVRRLTFSLAEEFPHVWTADSRKIIFESNQNGAFDLYRQSIDRRESEPLVVSRVSKVLPEMSPDGRWLLYHEISQYMSLKVMRVPIEGGTPELVLTNKDVQGEFRCGVHPSARCIIREVDNDQFVFYELHPLGGRGQELARTNWSPNIVGDWALSPDGSRVAIPNHDSHDAKLRLVALDREHTGVQEKSVTVEGLKNLNGVVWAADGRGWFVSVRTDYGGLLTFVDLHGRVVNLLETASPTYAVPSPDGRRIAFPEWNSVTNAWLFHGL